MTSRKTVLLSWRGSLAGGEVRLRFILHVQLDEGRNDKLIKDAKNVLLSWGRSLAGGEVRLRLILYSSAG